LLVSRAAGSNATQRLIGAAALAELLQRRVGSRHVHEHAARDHLLVATEQLDGVGINAERAAIVAGSFQREPAQIVRALIGRRTPDIPVGDFDGLRIVGQPEKNTDRLIERTQRRSAFPDEFVQPFSCRRGAAGVSFVGKRW